MLSLKLLPVAASAYFKKEKAPLGSVFSVIIAYWQNIFGK